MKKGFMFSIEAMISMVLVLSALGLIAYSSSYGEMDNGQIRILAQAGAAESMYFGTAPLAKDYNNLLCEKIAYYDRVAKKVSERSSCRGYE